MTNFLQQILQTKQTEINALKTGGFPFDAHNMQLSDKIRENAFLLEKTLAKPELSVIAEIKRNSPAEGFLAPIMDPKKLAGEYVKGGADAISVLTDKTYFFAQDNDLQRVKEIVDNNIPILRKDFIIDPLQIIQSVLIGANVILLIARVLQDRLPEFIQNTAKIGLESVVEVHDEIELEMAIEGGATIIGINNRDLKSFDVSLETSFNLIEKIPQGIFAISESGISHPSQAKLLHQHGFEGVLIGKTLVTASDPTRFIQECKK
jgi:indole-3-glycerol phosphate synthase